MTIRKKLLIAVLLVLTGSGYMTMLFKLAALPLPKVSYCLQHAYACYPPPVRLWP